MKIGAYLGFVLLAILLLGPSLGQRTAEDWNDKGIDLAEQGKYNEALQAFDKAIEINPKDAPTWNDKGDALRLLGRVDEADTAYAKAKELGYTGGS
jgi:Flp pilus assembly protein TadD